MADEFSSILAEPEAPTPEEMGEAPAPEQSQAGNRDEQGRFAPQGAESAATPPKPEPEEDPRDKKMRGLEAALSDLRNELRQYKQPAPQPEEAKPEPRKALTEDDVDVDPLTGVKYSIREISEIKQMLQAQQQQQQQQQAEAQVFQHLNGQLEAYTAEAPDVRDAFTFAVGEALKRASEAGIAPQDADAQIKQWIVQTTVMSDRLGVNPGMVILNKAKEFGYQPKAADPAPAQPTAAQQPAPTPRRDAPVSLSRMTGGSPGAGSVMNPLNMSYVDIGKLSEAEFAKMNGVR